MRRKTLATIRAVFCPNKLFVANFETQLGRRSSRVTLVKNGYTTRQDFLEWLKEKQEEIEPGCLITYAAII